MGDVSAENAASDECPGEIHWYAVRDEWLKREFSTLEHAVSSLGGNVVADVDKLLFAERPPSDAEALTALRAAFAAGADAEDGRLLVALYVHGRCLEKWERTEDYERIGRVLCALKDAAQDGPAHGLSAELAWIVVQQAQATNTAMSVEDALSCSCPVALGARATSIAELLDDVLARERELAPGLGGARDVVRSDAETGREYFDAVSKVAAAVYSFVGQPSPAPTDCFDEALVALASTSKAGDVYESELRAYRATLECLRACAAEPRLLVDEAELVYLYPFALDAVEPKAVVARALHGELNGAFVKLGLGAVVAYELEVNDLWVSHARADGGYSGASIELPEISVEPTGGGGEIPFTAEVRLSRLGNHQLRIQSQLAGAGLHEVNQALRRASHAMGEEKHTSAGRVWPRTKFPRYVRDVIDTIAVQLGAEAVTDPASESHVVLTARSMSIQRPGGGHIPAKLPELEAVVGATLLFHPVRHLATSLEEWIRYPPPTVTNLLSEGYDGDFVVRTDNTTVSLMPASPEWLIAEYEEMIEFVASVPSLLALWEKSASDRALRLDRARLSDASIDQLHDQELTNLHLEQDIRRQLAFLRSPLLCRTHGQRVFLDALWEQAGLPAAEAELEQQLTRLAERQERIAALVRSKERERTEKQHERNERLSRRIEIVLAVLAVASVAGAIQWFGDAFAFHGRSWAIGESLFLVALAVAAFAAVRGLPHRRRFRNLDVHPDSGLLHRFYRDVLLVSFSPEELDDVETIERGLRGDGETRVLASVALGHDMSPIGGIVGDLFADERVLLVSYLAVLPDQRGRGTGRELIKHALGSWKAKYAFDVVVAEVHDPRAWLDIAGEDAERRLRFFGRAGARVLDVPFVQPALRLGADRVTGFLLLALDAESTADLPSALIARFVERYYQLAEDAREPYDPTLTELLGRINARKTIRLLSVADYDTIRPLGAGF
jgi:ribosomal protein S18 acetylase RimI-like enzyme